MKQFLIIFFIAFSSLTSAQKGKSVLILKDSSRIDGTGEVSGISSIISVKFKNDTLKYRTYKSKEIIGIDILENNYYRKFRYKHIDGGKYPEIVEIISIDSLSLYIRIYEGSVLSNSFSDEPISMVANKPVQTVQLDNGQEINISESINIYKEINFPRYSYYVGEGESDQVEHLYTKGLPFAKSFKKSIKRYFKNCPSLIEKVEKEKFLDDDLWEVIEYYNRNCLNSKHD